MTSFKPSRRPVNPPANHSKERQDERPVWYGLPYFMSTAVVQVDEPFHTPLHLHQAVTRKAQFAHHVLRTDAGGSVHLSKDLFGSLEDGLLSGSLPSHISIEPSGRKGARSLRISYGSPNKMLMDLFFSLALLAGCVNALLTNSPLLGTALGLSLFAGLAPSLVLEFRARGRFLATVRESLSRSTSAETPNRAA